MLSTVDSDGAPVGCNKEGPADGAPGLVDGGPAGRGADVGVVRRCPLGGIETGDGPLEVETAATVRVEVEPKMVRLEEIVPEMELSRRRRTVEVSR
jgi:hypothetical protein